MDAQESVSAGQSSGDWQLPLSADESPVRLPSFSFILVAALFVASGFSSLVYQVVWTRLLVLVFGSTTQATSTVLAVFMGGLALGSFAAGRYSDRIKRPFLWYGLLEGVIGLWALLVPLLFQAAQPLYCLVWQSLHLSLTPFSLLRVLIAALILLVPTSCMGATLPLLARFVTVSLEFVGRRVGTLYAVNTLGAVGGAAITGFLLLPLLGMEASTLVAALINFLLCGLIVWIAPKVERSGAALAKPEAAAAANHLAWDVRLAIGCFALSGAIAMVYEVCWTRTLLMVIGSSTYAFTVMLSTFLAGIFAGSLICARLIDKSRQPLFWFAALECLICLCGLLSISQFNCLPWWNLVINSAFPQDPNLALAVRFLLAATILMPLTLGLGAIFPAVVKSSTRQLEAVGRSVGTLYSANTLGAIVGALYGGFCLVPWIGVEKTLLGASLANLVLGLVLLSFVPAVRPLIKVAALAAGLAATWSYLQKPDLWDRIIILSAQTQRRLLVKVPLAERSFAEWQNWLHRNREVLFYEDGASSTVGVMRYRQADRMALVTNGHIDASNGLDMDTQVLLSVLPLLWQPRAESVGVVGWGSGVTVGSALRFPVKSLTAIELEPAVLRASTLFHRLNHRPEADPRLRVEINDGRNYFQASREQFDVIVSEPSNPWRAGVCDLFTREYFEICRQRLKAGGIFSLWMQTVEIPPDSLRGILKSLNQAFPYEMVLSAGAGDRVVLASDRPLLADYQRLRACLANEAVAGELRRVRILNPEAVLARILVAPDGVNRLVAGAQANVDDTNRLEYSVGRTYESQVFFEDNTKLLESSAGNLPGQVKLGDLSATSRADIYAAVAKEALLAGHAVAAERWSRASLALARNAEALRLLGIARLEQGHPEEARSCWEEALAVQPGHVATLQTRGLQELESGDRLAARSDFLRALSCDRGNQVARYLIAKSYAATDSVSIPFATAPACFPSSTKDQSPAKVLEYLNGLADNQQLVNRHHDLLLLAGQAHCQLGQTEEAEALIRRYLSLEPDSVFGARLLGNVLSNRGATREASAWWFASFARARPLCQSFVSQARDLLKTGKEDEAALALARAVELWPGDPEARAALVRLAEHNRRAAETLSSAPLLKAPSEDEPQQPER